NIPAPLEPVIVHAALAGVGGSRFTPVAIGQARIDLQLPETGQLDVTVAGTDPAAQLVVTATRTDPNAGGIRIWILDRKPGEGTFHAAVTPGPYVVRAGVRPRLEGSGGVAVTIDAGQHQ